MLDDRYFSKLGEPPRERMDRLPIWARVYIQSLRADATWWELASRGRQAQRRRVVATPADERIQRLPLFAVDWIQTLRFEVYWQRCETFKRCRAERPDNVLV